MTSLSLFKTPALLDSWLSDFDLMTSRSGGTITPAVDIAETEKSYDFKFDLPGVDKKDLHIEVKDNTLTVVGERKSVAEEKGKGYHRVERSFGKFQRVFQLPTAADTNSVDAKYTDGVLAISIGKTKDQQARKIELS